MLQILNANRGMSDAGIAREVRTGIGHAHLKVCCTTIYLWSSLSLRSLALEDVWLRYDVGGAKQLVVKQEVFWTSSLD